MIGMQIAHYFIEEKIGEGGMGVVYKAEDTKLKRTVALKFLKPQALGSEEDKIRFVREAQAAAALEHPSICTVYEINETDEKFYISMAYIDGISVKDKIEKNGPMSVEEALNVAIQVAQGLQEAHEKGVVHRDVKSANIIITEKDQVKIMDFGLAILSDSTKITKSGFSLGTPAYMSPEQVDGKEVDNRSDIFSLGVVLYEMLTGKLPFLGKNDFTMMYSIIHKAQESIDNYREGIPKELQYVINRALEKETVCRYQYIEDFLSDLQGVNNSQKSQKVRFNVRKRFSKPNKNTITRSLQIATLALLLILGLKYFVLNGKPNLDPNSIAVMYFDNLSNDVELNWYRKGMAELLAANLKQEPGLKIVDSENLFYAIQDEGILNEKQITLSSALNIARNLEVGTLIMGNFLKIGERTRFNVKLCDVNEEKIFAAENLDIIKEDEIFKCMKEVSNKIMTHLEILEIEDESFIATEEIITNSVDAFKNYILGADAFSNLNFSKAIQYFKTAIAKDSSFTSAYLLLVHAASNIGEIELAKKTLSIGSQFMQKGTLKDKLLYEMLGLAKQGILDLYECYLELGHEYLDDGYPERAIDFLIELVKLDSTRASSHFLLAKAYFKSSKYQNAINAYYKCLDLNQQYKVALFWIGEAFEQMGKIEEAISAYSQYISEQGKGHLVERSHEKIKNLQTEKQNLSNKP